MSETLTKKLFVEKYKQLLPQAYPWATDNVRLEKFMASVCSTIGTAYTGPYTGDVGVWNFDSKVARAITKGHIKRYTLKALRSLPDC